MKNQNDNYDEVPKLWKANITLMGRIQAKGGKRGGDGESFGLFRLEEILLQGIIPGAYRFNRYCCKV